MSIINDIEIKNFKSIRHQKIEGCKRINVFVGPPNVGKSNILEGLGLLTYIKNSSYIRGFKSLVRVEKLTQLFNNYNFNEDAVIHFNKKYSFVVGYRDENEYNIRIYENEFGNIEKLLLRPYHVLGKPIYKNEGSGFSRTEGVDDFLGDFVDVQKVDVRPYKFLHTKEFNASYSAKTFLIPEGSNMNEVIIANPKLQDEFEELLKPYDVDIVFDISNNEIGVTPKTTNRKIFPIPITLVADTLVRLMFFKTAIYANKNSVLLFEEPEANCYEPYIMEITNAIKNDKNENQFFIVTHSQYVIDELMRDEESRNDTNIYLVGLENNETKVKLLSAEASKDAYQTGLNLFFNYQTLWDEN
jgi:AAA15 family ATPase/GTPase